MARWANLKLLGDLIFSKKNSFIVLLHGLSKKLEGATQPTKDPVSETNVAPENSCLEDDPFLLGMGHFFRCFCCYFQGWYFWTFDQEFQVPTMEVLNLIMLFLGVGVPLHALHIYVYIYILCRYRPKSLVKKNTPDILDIELPRLSTTKEVSWIFQWSETWFP